MPAVNANKSRWRKLFWEGQTLMNTDPTEDFLSRAWTQHRKYFAFLLPFGIMQVIWWTTALKFNWIPLFSSRWQMPVVMVFGSTIAGMTSEGGGAVAFPVMTLLLGIDPGVARDYFPYHPIIRAMMVVLIMGIQIERSAVVFGVLGAVPGVVFGSLWIDPLFSSSEKKMLFVSVWASFAVSLFVLNSQPKRKTFHVVPHLKPWKAFVLLLTGFVGGNFTALAGSGVDICIFSVTTLLFRISEKTATPTSVVLMGLVTMVGAYWRAAIEGGISSEAWEYGCVSIPVAVTMAPIGSFLGSHLHRKVLAWMVYVLEGLAVLGFLLTLPPLRLVLIGSGIIAISFLFFRFLTHVGEKIMINESQLQQADAIIEEDLYVL